MLKLPAAITSTPRLRRITESLRQSAVALPAAEKGGVATIVGLSILPLLAALGLAVDGGLAYGAQSKLQGAVDAAALAGARVASSEGGDVEADARMFFDANFPKDFLGSDLSDFKAVFNEETGELTINAEIDLPTSFMRVAGVETVPVAASAVAQQQLSGIELAMVLDVTGSMDDPDPLGGTKLQALKGASETLLDVIYGEDETVNDVSISVIPYNTEVNVGSDRTDLLAGFDETAFGDEGWKGCVEARAEPFDQDDTPPSAAAFTALLWPEVVDDPRTRVDETRFNRSNDPNAFCPDSEILPLTAERSIISDHIDDLEAEGFTMTNVGLTWGWRTISPRWQGDWGASSDPVAYNHPTIGKAIIFMTDGLADWSSDYYTAYGFLRDEGLNTRNEGAAEDEVDRRLLESCELAKEQDIEIYTIMFALDDETINRAKRSRPHVDRAIIEQNYRACASSDEHFFDAPDGDALDAAFRDIAGQLTSLRLTQ